jgi:tetratricopeptide (TPR) repeat protein
MKKPGIEFINLDVLQKQIYDSDMGYDKNYRPGFKFRGLNDPGIFYDDNHLRMVSNYRNAFIRLALYYLETGKKESTVQALDLMEKKLPRSIIPLETQLKYQLGNVYFEAGAEKQYKILYGEVEKEALKMIVENPNNVNADFNPYSVLMVIYENLKDYKNLTGLWQKVQVMYPNDPSVKEKVEKYKAMIK